MQCTRNQPASDKLIPLYFKSKTDESDSSLFSQILIRDESTKESNKTWLDGISRKDDELQFTSELPYIVILADLGVEANSKLNVTYTTLETDIPDAHSTHPVERCLRVYAPGINGKTFPFLVHQTEVLATLEDLAHSEDLPEIGRPFAKKLGNEVKFGFSPQGQLC